MKKFILIDRATRKPVYNAQVFEAAISPAGLLGGEGQRLWFWQEVTDWTQAQLDDRRGKTRSDPSISATEANVVVTAAGTWS